MTVYVVMYYSEVLRVHTSLTKAKEFIQIRESHYKIDWVFSNSHGEMWKTPNDLYSIQSASFYNTD